jgi:carbon-monoxide dehydrogenase small subunit
MTRSKLQQQAVHASQDPTASVTLKVNGVAVERAVSVRMLLSDFLRHEIGLTGTHVGCEHGVCGCCTVLINGKSARSCLTLAVQASGAEITTIEALAQEDGTLHAIQQAFKECHALQCGYCTPGMIMAAADLLRDNPHPTDEEIREGLEGNLCRCTGYENIVRAVRRAAQAGVQA